MTKTNQQFLISRLVFLVGSSVHTTLIYYIALVQIRGKIRLILQQTLLFLSKMYTPPFLFARAEMSQSLKSPLITCKYLEGKVTSAHVSFFQRWLKLSLMNTLLHEYTISHAWYVTPLGDTDSINVLIFGTACFMTKYCTLFNIAYFTILNTWHFHE